jgi:hypothetical protein
MNERTETARVEPVVSLPVTFAQAVQYEIAASWWACLISNDMLQNFAARYFIWKTTRKMERVQRIYNGINVILSRQSN